VIAPAFAPAKVIPSDWNAYVHIPGRSLRFDMALMRAVTCGPLLSDDGRSRRRKSSNQTAFLAAFAAFMSCFPHINKI
jgi:hypothetical protein